MGLFFWKGIENNAFRPRDDGDWDFFPNGALGGGYRVNAEQRERIAAALRGFYGIATVVIIAGIGLGAFLGGFRHALPVLAVLFAAMIAYWFFLLRPLWRGLPRAERRLGFGEAQSQVAQTMPKWRIVYVLVVSPLFGLLSLFGVWLGNSKGETSLLVIGLIGLLFGIAGTWAGIVMWRKRQAFERQGS